MTKSAARSLLGAATLIAAFTGCGDSGPDAADYRSEVNAICTAGNERIEALFAGSPLGPDSTEPELLDMLDRILSEISGQIDDIDEIETPDELATDVDAWLADGRATIASTRSGGVRFFAQQEAGDNPFASVNAKAVALGLDACGE